jgi:hypothetical protein
MLKITLIISFIITLFSVIVRALLILHYRKEKLGSKLFRVSLIDNPDKDIDIKVINQITIVSIAGIIATCILGFFL